MAMPAGLKKYWAGKKRAEKARIKKKAAKSTRKGGARKYIRKAYEKSKQKVKRKSSKSKSKSNKPRKKSDSILKLPKLPKIVTKIAVGLGAATIASMVVGIFAPQFVPIAKPIAALAAGGIPGVAAELVIDQGLLGNVMGIFNGGGINETRLASGL